MLGVLQNPMENFTVTLTEGQLFAQRGGINANKVEEVRVKRAVLVVLAVGARDFSPSLV